MSNMVVRTNVFALNAHRNLTNVGLHQRQAAQRLSSGFRINSAADDAAGLAISESMRAQIRGLDQASINAQDGVGLIQTAEGAMATVSEMVIRIRELLVQAANDTYTVGQRGMIQTEIDQLMTEINDVTFRTEFNTRTLLDGGLSGGGGQTSPVSLQWMLFQQARVVGVAQPGADRLQPNERTDHSLRGEIIGLQEELNDLIERIAYRKIQDDSSELSRNTFDMNFRTNYDINSGSSNAPPNGLDSLVTALDNHSGLTTSETQELRSIANRLNSSVLGGIRAAQEIYQLVNDQIRALGGVAASNHDGTNVFIGAATDHWNNGTMGTVDVDASTVRSAIEGMSSNGTGTADPAGGGSPFDIAISTALVGDPQGLRTLSNLLREMVGHVDRDGNRVAAGSDGIGSTLSALPPNLFSTYDGNGGFTASSLTPHNFLSALEHLFDNGMGVLGTVNLESNAMWFQIGPNSMQGMILQLKGMHTGILGGGRGDLAMMIDVRENSGIPISQQLDDIDRAEGIVNQQRAQLGAVQNRLEFTRQSLDISSENLSAAESRIRDTDMAREMMRFTQAQVLQQAGISMLAQANQLPSSILQLLQ
ncbi:MAG: hypothetical protein FWF78_09250 [Defluviitaleaceae bacterium]|nr:hypothetical protein [Defluviitaleaceae bacterium]